MHYSLSVWPSQILMDAEGMLSGSGFMGDPVTGGTGFAFHFYPVTLTMLWARVYPVSNPTFIRGMVEVLPSGNLLLLSDSQSPNQIEFYWIDKTKGALFHTSLSPQVKKCTFARSSKSL